MCSRPICRDVPVHDELRSRANMPYLRRNRAGTRGGKPESEARSFADGAHHTDLAAHELGQRSTDRQAEASPALKARIPAFNLHERIEDALQVLSRDANSGIFDGDARPFVAVQAFAAARAGAA